MRLRIKEFDEHFFSPKWSLYKARHDEAEQLYEFKKCLAEYEGWCKEKGEKWLLGTNEPTELDIHCGVMWDLIYCRHGGVYQLASEVLERETFAPCWVAYMKRFRTYPAFYPYRLRKYAVQKLGEKCRVERYEKKLHLTLDVLEDVFEVSTQEEFPQEKIEIANQLLKKKNPLGGLKIREIFPIINIFLGKGDTDEKSDC